MNIVVEVKNEILRDGEFWRGPADHINEIRNIAVRRLAKLVCTDGMSRKIGMWHVRLLQG